MFTARTRSIIGACAVLCGLAVPVTANAASLYVSNSAPVVPGGKSCTQPNYATIQGAIDALKSLPGGKVNVCPGTYAEQLTIVNPVTLTVAGTPGSAKVVLPLSLKTRIRSATKPLQKPASRQTRMRSRSAKPARSASPA